MFGLSEETKRLKPRFVGYDRSCDLHPCILNMLKRGALPKWAAKFFEGIDFFVDRFHANKHVEDCCTIGKPTCRYHPDLPRFDAIRNVNTAICEQTFRWFNILKANTRNMTMCHFWWFVDVLINEKNKARESELRGNGMFTEDSKADEEEEATLVAKESEKQSTMPLYEVSRILDKRVNPVTGEMFYSVKWKGYLERTVEEVSTSSKMALWTVKEFEEKLRKNPKLFKIVDPESKSD